MSPWAKVDDKFHSHPKRFLVPLAADGLWVRALSYAAQHLTDGFVPEGFVKSNVPSTARRSDPEGVVDALLKHGLFEAVDGGYRIVDYLDYNPSRDEVLRSQAEKSEAGRKGALSRWHGKRHSSSHSNPHDPATPDGDGKTMPQSRTHTQPNKDEGVREVFDYWATTRGKRSPKFSDGRRDKIHTRLREGYSVEQLKKAIDGVANDEWEDRPKHDDLTVIFRNAEQVEKFLELAEVRRPNRPPQPAEADLRCRGCRAPIDVFRFRNRSRLCQACEDAEAEAA